jgi:T-complex protein 1 subunit delta
MSGGGMLVGCLSCGETKKDSEKSGDVRMSNITAAKGVADCVRTSLGPRGMDKMIVEPKGEVIISNDGATILSKLQVTHPCSKMLVELSRAQDVEAGDGTTSVVVLCGALLRAVETLLEKGIHPTMISESFQLAARKAEEIITGMATPIDIEDRETLIKAAITSLNSKVVSSNSPLLAPIAVDAVKRVMKPNGDVDLRDVRVVTALGGTIDDSEMITGGTVFKQKASHSAGGPTKIKDATIALIQFCLSPPKTDVESTITVSDYTQMDRALKEERKYLLDLCKKIKDAGVNVLLIQKSVLRDAVTAQSLDFLAKMKIMVIKDIERNDIDFIVKTLGVLPVANVDNLTPDKFGHADSVVESTTPDGKIIKVLGIKAPAVAHVNRPFGRTSTIFIRGSNHLVVAEADRSLHDALCVIRSIVKRRAIIAGGAAAEIEICMQLGHYARKEAEGVHAFCMRAYADAFEVIPYTLAENAGLNPISIVTELRNAHAKGSKSWGVNVRKGCVTDMLEENVVQPLLVGLSALKLATETVVMILKIDDIVLSR